jgi:hypothetical protein
MAQPCADYPAMRSSSPIVDAGTGLEYARILALLQSERELVEVFLYRLLAQRSILTSGSTRWLSRSTEEISDALRQLRTMEVIRAAEHEDLMLALDLPAELTLLELALVAPAHPSGLLGEHRFAMRELLAAAEAVAADNRTLLTKATGGEHAAGEATRHGSEPTSYSCARQTITGVRQSSLTAYLA